MKRFFTPGWLGIHLIAIVLFVAFLAFGWWQFERAQAGNARSWGYTFEWPVFAGFVIVMWVKMIRDELKLAKLPPADPDAVPAVPVRVLTEAQLIKEAEAENPELAAYNRRLARLAAQNRR